MKYLLMIMVLLFTKPMQADVTTELTEFITDFLKLYPQRRKAALTYIPTIVAECGEDIDPLLIAVIVSMESSWRVKALGKLNEVGLLQIMPRYAKGYHLEDPHEQIRAGINHLRKALKMCKGNIKDAVNAVGCGRCKPHLQFLKWRWHWYQKAIRKYRKELN
jgi:hypothetical protein